ncbi:unannotated protein [freshwater metagenome]|uniref:Unannotated protein n=2 Tax=freshwater metagenome TaxID=449393 RepID=A0A6J7ILQ8_9ZZZZ
MSELPFVARPPGDHEAVVRVAHHAASHWGLPEPVLLRVGMNALFAVGSDVLLRIGHTTAPPEQALSLAELLTKRGVPVARHLLEPIVVEGYSVFAVERVHSHGPVDWCAVGAAVRRVHETPIADVVGRHPLPRGAEFPWWNTAVLLEEVDDLLDDGARAGLLANIREHGDWQTRVTPHVLCHGDVHPGNVVQSADGPVLLDWDLLCRAPAAWDHAAMLTWEQRWGGEAGAYVRFAEGYGRTLADDSGARSLAVLRNVAATLMRVRASRTNPDARDEAQRRLAYWRGDTDAPQWNSV